ncbi:myb-like dna-binding [Plasmopara halstedii]|uniref:Myb-like dna-binding n=1 Tax=Plasmopara halstedii TaxID=4781 RepID=A0A0N7L626_PLAHL|nr:myb-like dna-binding [Plasmopara halstedii]CEG43099.1 myb-like dna-binding [Plasmopara halstedii]|eukprot:XP_024579468.1 myb-like dna-binding [Plasmopara halstedii]
MVAESIINKRERDAVGVEPRSDQAGEASKKKTGGVVSKRWTPEQDEALKEAVAELGHRNWMAVAERVPGRDNAQCLQRWNKVLKPGLVKGPWSVEEDAMLMEMMLKGYDNWRQVSNSIPGRTAKQCRERWRNRLDPSINKSPFTEKEDEAIQQAYEKYGNRWTQIAELLPGRTEDAVKLRWKALNPNQKTYTKLGRPRLLNTDDAPSVSTSPVRPKVPYISRAQPVKKKLAHLPVPAIDNGSGSNQVNFEPIVASLEDMTDERMSEEDIMILNEFLRGHSNQSLENGSYKSLLSAANLTNIASKPVSSGRSTPRMLNKMLSLGETKSASLRSITADVEPDDSWINGGLTRRLSSLSLASLNDTGSLMNLPLDYGNGIKIDSTVACNGAGLTDTIDATTQDSLHRLMMEENIPAHGLSATTNHQTMTAQEFYSTATPHDQLSTVNRFEI